VPAVYFLIFLLVELYLRGAYDTRVGCDPVLHVV
jgi:hypothetical protein